MSKLTDAIDPIADAAAPRKDTGIYVRAKLNGSYTTVDLSQLDKPSLLAWLRLRPHAFTEEVLCQVLGHRDYDCPAGVTEEEP